MSTGGVTYHVNASWSGDSLSFGVTPYARAPLATERERLFDRYTAVSRAIDLLEDDHAGVVQARELLTVYRDSLEGAITK